LCYLCYLRSFETTSTFLRSSCVQNFNIMAKHFFILFIVISFFASCNQTQKTALPSIIEIVTNDARGDEVIAHSQKLEAMNLQANIYLWKNHLVIYGVFPDAAKTQKQIAAACPEASVRLYDKPFYVFDRHNCEDTVQAKRWKSIIMTANLVVDTVLQKEYLNYHAHQPELFPEVAQGFCRAGFQQLLVFRNDRQLMLVISIPEEENLDDLNPKTTENNPRVDEWNVIMAKYQEGIEGTEPGETWVAFDDIK